MYVHVHNAILVYPYYTLVHTISSTAMPEPTTHLSVLHHKLHTGAYLHTGLTSHLTVVEEDL